MKKSFSYNLTQFGAAGNTVTEQIKTSDGIKTITTDANTGAVILADSVDPDSLNPVTAAAVADAVASASGEVPVIGDGDNGKVLKAVVDGSSKSVAWGDYQEKLTAGDNITIENNVISATGGNNFTTMSPVVAPPDGSGLFIQAGHGLQERVLDYMQYELPSVQVAGAEDEYTYRIISPWKLRCQETLNTDTTDSANSTIGFFLASNVPSGLSNCVVQWSCDRNRSAYIRSKTLLVSTYSSTLRYVPCNSQLLNSNGYFFSIPLPKSVLADVIQEDSRFDVGGDWSSYTGALPSMFFSLYNTVTNQYISLPHTDGEKMAVRKEYNLRIDYTKVQGKLTAGNNITISNNVISATAEPQVNADWDASSGVSMILNKPTVDQVYDASSTNAQSGTAVAGAIAGVRQVPSTQSSDNGKVLGVTDSSGTLGWVSAGGGGGSSASGYFVPFYNSSLQMLDTSIINAYGTYIEGDVGTRISQHWDAGAMNQISINLPASVAGAANDIYKATLRIQLVDNADSSNTIWLIRNTENTGVGLGYTYGNLSFNFTIGPRDFPNNYSIKEMSFHIEDSTNSSQSMSIPTWINLDTEVSERWSRDTAGITLTQMPVSITTV